MYSHLFHGSQCIWTANASGTVGLRRHGWTAQLQNFIKISWAEQRIGVVLSSCEHTEINRDCFLFKFWCNTDSDITVAASRQTQRTSRLQTTNVSEWCIPGTYGLSVIIARPCHDLGVLLRRLSPIQNDAKHFYLLALFPTTGTLPNAIPTQQ